jgi:hypothetical protein
MRFRGIPFIFIFGLVAAMSSGQQSKPNFSGKWQISAEKSELHSGKASTVNLTIDQKGPSIHFLKTMKAANGKESVIDVTCTTDGKDCDARGVKISLWYDGASLVEMDVSDDLVTKSSMTLGEDGKTIKVGVTYISPQAEADKLLLEKM